VEDEDIVAADPGIEADGAAAPDGSGASREDLLYIGPGQKQPKLGGCRAGVTRSTGREKHDFSCPR
jgi:hypothetical protein